MKVSNRPFDVFKFREVLALANGIGYDLESDDDQYFWFLKRILINDMPQGWVKENSMMGEAYYHNTQLNVTTSTHPFIKEYRKLFAQTINKKKETHKQIKEDIKINLSLSAKVQNQNQQSGAQDQTKKNQKRATFIPANQSQPTQRDLIAESKQLIQAQEPSFDTQTTQDDNEDESQILDLKEFLTNLSMNSTKTYQRIQETQSLVKALSFYEKLVGLQITRPPHYLKNHPDYLQITPDELIKLGIKYRLDLKTELDLLWVVRMVRCLPLPPFWKREVNQIQKPYDYQDLEDIQDSVDKKKIMIYRDLNSNTQFSFHPCSLFLIKLLNKLRLSRMNNGNAPFMGKNSRQKQRKSSFVKMNQNQNSVQFQFMDNLNRIYKCSGKDLFDLAYDQINMGVDQNRAMEDLFQYDNENIEQEFESLTKVFEQQVSTFIHEKSKLPSVIICIELTDFEIQALAEQCRLSTTRETYLYKALYEFLSDRYQEQEKAEQNYEEEKAKHHQSLQNNSKVQDSSLLAGPVPPKVWIFRKTLEGPYYWIDTHTKEISKVFPYLKELRKTIEEVKVTNTAIEQFVSSKSQVKVLKKVENYMKLKAYSTTYIQNLITISSQKLESQETKLEKAYDSGSERESSSEEEEDFLTRVMKDLEIENEVSKEQLLQWMFAWPYEMSEEYFSRKDEIQAKIHEDLILIRQKAQQRQEVLQRMIKKINVINRIGKSLGGSGVSQKTTFMTDVQARRVQEEELLQKIKKTKAVIGVSDIRIRKKLRVLLTRAMQDESERDKLQELEMLEKELLDSNQKKKQDHLKQKLKQQLGLDDSGISEEDEEDSEGIVDPGLDGSDSMKSGDENLGTDEEGDGVDDENEEPDEPADDSFTFHNTGNTRDNIDEEELQSQEQHQDDEVIFNEEQQNLIEDQNHAASLNKTNPKSEQASALQIPAEETIEQRRKRLQQMILDKKIKELTESSIFIKRVRRKLRQMNITKTQDDLKKKIIQLKMLHLKVRGPTENNNYNSNQESNQEQIVNNQILEEDEAQEKSQEEQEFDFLDYIVRLKENQSSSDDSFHDDSSVSMFDKISEVDSQLEIDDSLRRIKEQQPESPQLKQINSMDDVMPKKREQNKVNNFYDDFTSVKKIENFLMKRQNSSSDEIQVSRSGTTIIKLNANNGEQNEEQEGLYYEDGTEKQSKSQPGSPLKWIKKSSTLLSKGYDEMQRQNSLHNPSNAEMSPQKSGQLSRRNSTPFMNYDDQQLSNKNQYPDFDEKTGINYMTVVLPGSPGINEFERGRTARQNKLDSVLEEEDLGGDETSKQKRKSNSPLSKMLARKTTIDGNDRFRIEILKTKTLHHDSGQHMNQLKILKAIANKEDVPGFGFGSDDFRSKDEGTELVLTEEVDQEFQKFLQKIKVFDDSPEVHIDFANLDPYQKFIYDYYLSSIGDYKLPKEQLNLCDKNSQALNIDSLLFTAQRLGIKVLAQRETDLMWIAQEYLTRPNPNMNEFQGEKPQNNGENPVEKLKNYFFKQMVKEHRKMRVDKISKMVKDSQELDKLIFENSWVTICDKGEYYKYNFQTKDKEAIVQTVTMTQETAELSQTFQNSMRQGFLNFLKKKGLGNTLTQEQELLIQQQAQEKAQQYQQQQQQMIIQINQEQNQSSSSKTPYIDSASKSKQKFFPRSSDPKQVSLTVPSTQLNKIVESNSETIQERIDVKEFKIDNFPHLSIPNDNNRKTLTSHQLPRVSSLSNIPQQLFNTFESKNEDQRVTRISNKPSLNTRPMTQSGSLKVLIDKKSDDLVKFTPISSMMPKYDADQNPSSKSGPRTLKSQGSNLQVPRQTLNPLLMKNRPSIISNHQMEDDFMQLLQATSTGLKVPLKNIKRVILNNHQENYTRMQIKKYEESQYSMGFQQNKHQPCYKFVDKHLYNTLKSPLDDMQQTLQSSANFNTKIFKRLQDKIKLKPFSYLTQANLEQKIIQKERDLKIQKEYARDQLDLAQNLASTMAYHYQHLNSSVEKLDFLKETKKLGFHLDLPDSQNELSSCGGFMSARTSRKSQQAEILERRNDFRNMSPKSLQRWAQGTDLNLELARKSGVLNRKHHISSSYARLRRTQDTKMTFSTIPQQQPHKL